MTNVEDTVYSDAEARAALANSNGFCDSYEETQCYAFAYAFAGDGADRMTGMGFAVGRGPDELDPEQVGHEAADRALALHGARQPESRRCPVVLDPFVAASFASIIGGTLSADAVQRGRSLFAGREGEQIAAPAFRLVDDGLHPEGLATAPFDGEGVAQQTTAADRGRRAAHLPVRHLHGATRRGRELDRQRRARAPTGRRPRSALQPARRAGRRERRRPAEGGGRRPLRDGRERAALRRQPGLGQLLRGRHRAADPGRGAGRAGARDDDRLRPRGDAARVSRGPPRRPAGCRSGAASRRRPCSCAR